jgi:acetolactate synthase I/II/III large subunit
MATSGPGATNLVTGLADAKLDSIPIIAITGQVATAAIGSDAFQETPIVEVCRGITKHHYLVTDVADLPRVMKEAFHVATTGRPGRCWSICRRTCSWRRSRSTGTCR